MSGDDGSGGDVVVGGDAGGGSGSGGGGGVGVGSSGIISSSDTDYNNFGVSLFILLLCLFSPLAAMDLLGFFTDPPSAKAIIGPSAPAAASGQAACGSGAGSFAGSSIILACQGFQNTQLPNVFPEVPPAVATPTPAPVETPTSAPQSSTSTSTSVSHSTQTVTPPPANCVPSTMSVSDGTGTHTISGSGSSTDKTFGYTSVFSSDHSISFTISGLIKCTNQLHHIVNATATGSGTGRACNAQTTSTVTAGPVQTFAPSEDWTIHVYEGPGC
jgi:hypothetical protein